MSLYLMHGLVVSSPVELAAAPAEPGSAPDVVIAVDEGVVPAPQGVRIARSEDSQTTGYDVTRLGDSWTVTFGLIAAATAHRADETVRMITDPKTDSALLTVLLSGPVLAVVAQSRGHTLLHASAAWSAPSSHADSAGVVAVLGERGSGKSTVARILAGTPGSGLLTDDALRVDLAGSDASQGPLVHRGTTRTRLRNGAILGSGELTSVSFDGRLTVEDATPAPATGRLRAVVCPLLSAHFEVVRTRPMERPTDVLLVAGSWAIGEVFDGALLADRLSWATLMAGRVPFYALEVPWGPHRRGPGDQARLRSVVTELVEAMPASGTST